MAARVDRLRRRPLRLAPTSRILRFQSQQRVKSHVLKRGLGNLAVDVHPERRGRDLALILAKGERCAKLNPKPQGKVMGVKQGAICACADQALGSNSLTDFSMATVELTC